MISARFVRIYPVTFYNHKDLRFEMYGIIQTWTAPLGLETGSIPDNRLSASSFNFSRVAAHGRLYGVSSWCKSIWSSGQSYLQVDLGIVMQITGIATQGNAGSNAWVTSYDLQFKYSTSDWQKRQGFQGNVDKRGLVIQMFSEPISARYLRLLPKTSNVLSCVRMEIYGNKIVARPEILSLTPSKIISASKGSWVEYQCEVKALPFVTILWKHNKKSLPSNSSVSTYSGGIMMSTLVLNYTNGNDFASACRRDDPSSQLANCSSVVACQAFYKYLLTEGLVKRLGVVYANIKVPLAPPVTLLKIRHHSAEVRWDPNVITIDRSSVKSYYIQYYPLGIPSQILNKTVGANTRMVHLGGLDANTSYVVQIRAVSIAGEGSWTTKTLTTIAQVPCSKKSLGMEDRTIPDVFITSSSQRDNSTMASLGRLQHSSSWCASSNDSSPYLQIDLGMTYVICAVATQGNPVNDEWVPSYELHYSRDGMNWRPLLERSNIKVG
jgi:coagulation factor V (labile factor)